MTCAHLTLLSKKEDQLIEYKAQVESLQKDVAVFVENQLSWKTTSVEPSLLFDLTLTGGRLSGSISFEDAKEKLSGVLSVQGFLSDLSEIQLHDEVSDFCERCYGHSCRKKKD